MKTILQTLMLAVVFLLGSFGLEAAPGDEHWDKQFYVPGVSNIIYAVAANGGKVYVGGPYNSGTSTLGAIQVWDGWQWTTLASLIGPGTPPVNDMVFMGNNLYAAGYFTNVNGLTIRNLAKWDGTTWTDLGLSGYVSSLAVDGGRLYAAGNFTNMDAGGVVMTNIGYWDGSAWHAMGGGIGKPGSGPFAVAAKNGTVYAGGLFTNSGPAFMTNIATWNGTTWSQVGGGIGVAGSTIVYGLGFNGNDLYAGGIFTTAGAVSATNIARWDGSTWSALGNGLSGTPAMVNNIGVLNGMLCVAGSFTVAGTVQATNFAVWNGSTWSAAGAGISATGYRVINNGTNVYVGGNFLAAGNMLANSIASWDGTQWAVLGTPGQINGINTSPKAVVGDGTNLFIAGATPLVRYVGQTNVFGVAGFKGGSWFPLGSGVSGATGASLYSLALSNSVLYAGGYFNNAGGVAVQNIAQWDGTNWYAMGNPGGVVASITVRSNGIYAAGASFNGSAYSSPFFQRWDGTAWNNVLSFNNDDTFIQFYLSDSSISMDAAAFMDTNIYVGGHFNIAWHNPDLSLETNCQNIMRFDGTYGRIVGTGLNSNVTYMAVINTNLYVAGLFTNAGGISANKLAVWNGNSWTNVGGSVVGTGNINTMTAVGNYLYVGGTFTNMGGVTASRIARWDGTNWSAMGSGLIVPGSTTGSASALGGYGKDLLVGGSFRIAGNKAAFDLARWSDAVNYDTPQLAALSVNNNAAKFRLGGIGGYTNIVLASTNLINWTPWLTNSAGIYDFTDPAAANSRARFFRATLGP